MQRFFGGIGICIVMFDPGFGVFLRIIPEKIITSFNENLALVLRAVYVNIFASPESMGSLTAFNFTSTIVDSDNSCKPGSPRLVSMDSSRLLLTRPSSSANNTYLVPACICGRDVRCMPLISSVRLSHKAGSVYILGHQLLGCALRART